MIRRGPAVGSGSTQMLLQLQDKSTRPLPPRPAQSAAERRRDDTISKWTTKTMQDSPQEEGGEELTQENAGGRRSTERSVSEVIFERE